MITPIRIAALFGASGVALGAFGSHGLRPILEANQTMEVWRTASFYHLTHAVVLLALAGFLDRKKVSLGLFSSGLLIFSGSLYVLAVSHLKWLGAVTPFGGLLLIAGWVSLAFGNPNKQAPQDR